MKNHPLFPEKPDADVQSIHVTRFEGGRKSWSAQKFAAEELSDVAGIFDRYGGGTFELIAHGPTGTKGHVAIVARQEYCFSGAPKPLNASDAAAPVVSVPVALPAAGGDAGLMAVMLQQAGEDRRMMMQMLASMTNRPPAVPDNSAMTALVAVMQNQGAILASALQGRSAPAAGVAADPIKFMLDVLEVGNNLRAGAAEGVAKAAGSGELDLDGLASAAEKMIRVIKDAKSLADSGGTPEQAAALASAAAE